MTDEIEQLLQNLKLGRMRSTYDEQLRAADQRQVSYSCAPNGITSRRARWSGAFAALICPNAGRWKPSPIKASPA